MAQEQYDIHTSVCLYKLLLTDLYRGRGQRRCFFRIKTFLMENVETLDMPARKRACRLERPRHGRGRVRQRVTRRQLTA